MDIDQAFKQSSDDASRDRQAKRHPEFVLIAGIGMTIVGLIWMFTEGDLKRNGVKTEGKIIGYTHVVPKDYQETRDKMDLLPSKEGYRAVVEFTDKKEKTYKFTSSNTQPKPGETGKSIEVTYLPDQPALAMAADEKRGGFSLWLILSGLGATAFGYKIMTRKSEDEEAPAEDVPDLTAKSPIKAAGQQADPEIAAYVERSRASGMSDAVIRETLLAQGWDYSAVAEALAAPKGN